MSTQGFHPHDHTQCIATAVQTAEAHCKGAGLKLTPVRRRVLEILLSEHRAMGAYDVLEILNAEGLGSQPPVVYRALNFLVSNGFAHRVERLNAFVACSHADADHSPAFLICRGCKTVVEADSDHTRAALQSTAHTLGFTIERIALEAEGLCPGCATGEIA